MDPVDFAMDTDASEVDPVATVDYVSFSDPDYLVAATALDNVLHIDPVPVQPVDDPVALFASCFADDPDLTDDFVSTNAPPLSSDPLASSPHQALHALHAHLRDLGTSRRSFYADLRVCAVGSASSVLQHGHMDGGSMVCTTDQRRLLWYFQDLTDCRVKLRVADNTPHTPQGFGYLRVPADTLKGYIEMKCYWTPSMPGLPLFYPRMPLGLRTAAVVTLSAITLMVTAALLLSTIDFVIPRTFLFL
jgi:hypothetical protein